MSRLTLWRNARLATLTPARGGDGWGLIDRGALLTEGSRIAWVGALADLPALARPAQEVDLGGALVTPGLVDCHTHLVYGGQRATEFEQRLQGVSYEAIARAGGGIRSSVARRLGTELPLTVRTTFLGAHAVPPEFEGRPDSYIDAVCAWLPELHAQGLVDAVDAFCERIGFSPAQTRRVFDTAVGLGLPVKLHAEQLSDQGGAALAASYRALSCDHLEHLNAEGIAAMRAAGTVAVLLPGAYYFLRETKLPPIEALRAAGVPLAVSTDHNPGTSPGLSLLLMASMACTLFRLTPLEAVQGITVNAARALGLADRGRLAATQRADFVAWNLDHPNELAYWFGRNPCHRVVVGGQERTPHGHGTPL